jgi:predicted TIM-barrel fold metal-dependent hydrolase
MTATGPVIDMWAPLVPSHEITADVVDHFPELQLGYLRVFQKREPDLEAARRAYRGFARDDGTCLSMLDGAGISRAMITGFDEASTGGTRFVSNEAVAAIADRHPDRFIPFAGSTSFAAPRRSDSSSTGSGRGAFAGSACVRS